MQIGDIVVGKITGIKDYGAFVQVGKYSGLIHISEFSNDFVKDINNIVIEIPEVSAYVFGYLAYFFEFACGVSAYQLGINPFNQPGVEAYKKNMFALLGKPGYESLKEELNNKIKGKK